MLQIYPDKNPRNFIEIDPDTDDLAFYIFCPDPIKRKPHLMLHPVKLKLQYAQIHLLLKMLVFIQMQNSLKLGTEPLIQFFKTFRYNTSITRKSS